MNTGENQKNNCITKHIRVYGIVQGVGFRPFVSRIADRIGVTGSVANKGSYVEIFSVGTEKQQEEFLQALEREAPERSAILKVDASDIENLAFDAFDIIESEREEGDIFVSPDIATCPKCRQELFDPTNRRYMHPFINCTACGPRLTILDAMPYDRERTSMKEFPMCPQCEFEYTHAETRRYDAQPVCCNDCGPQVYLLERTSWEEEIITKTDDSQCGDIFDDTQSGAKIQKRRIEFDDAGVNKSVCRGREAITEARKAIADGKIVAIKGIGGFHLCCDAASDSAVRRLRELKHRPAKPFAVMMKDLETVYAQCEASEAQEEILDGHAKPIILLKKKAGNHLADSVAPDNPNVGVMLPYAPVQMLLFDYNDGFDMPTDTFVMTSGNVSGAPICRTDEDALREISGFCDLILSHDRKIRLRADDSVMNFYKDEPYMIRRSRGYAPLPIMMDFPWHGQVLAVGGELKNTFCIAKNQLFYSSPYVGDMADVRTVQALTESITRMEELLEAKPQLAVCDLHPKYNTTVVAENTGLPVLKIQHHYAHILSCMAENNLPPDTKVIGVSFDGTGYGIDGTIWGGELLVADYFGFDRVGSIRPFLQIGGDSSAREGWRIAVSMVNALYPDRASEVAETLGLCDEKTRKLYLQMAARRINAVESTSAGRLFDAVSAILGIRLESSFEGEASTTLQFRAEEYLERKEKLKEEICVAEECDTENCSGKEEMVSEEEIESGMGRNSFGFSLTGAAESTSDHRLLLPTDELVRLIINERLAGQDVCKLAYLFHQILAEQIISGCRVISEQTGITSCALSGGVFQNQLLLELCEKGLTEAGLTVYRHRMIPPNDGGLALGQAAAGMAYLNRMIQGTK